MITPSATMWTVTTPGRGDAGHTTCNTPERGLCSNLQLRLGDNYLKSGERESRIGHIMFEL